MVNIVMDQVMRDEIICYCIFLFEKARMEETSWYESIGVTKMSLKEVKLSTNNLIQ